MPVSAMLPRILRICPEKSPATISLIPGYPGAPITIGFDWPSGSLANYLRLYDEGIFGANPGDESLPSCPDIEIAVGVRSRRLCGITLNWRPGLFQSLDLIGCGTGNTDEAWCTPELDMDSAGSTPPTGHACIANLPIRACWREDGALVIRLGYETGGEWIQPDRHVAILVSDSGELAGLTVLQPGLRENLRQAVRP